jgi:hypothetical protein
VVVFREKVRQKTEELDFSKGVLTYGDVEYKEKSFLIIFHVIKLIPLYCEFQSVIMKCRVRKEEDCLMSDENNMFENDNQPKNNPQMENNQWQQGNYNQPDYSQQQGNYSQPNYNQQPYQQNYTQPSSGFGIASMVCGILALITCCLWCTCIPLAVVSIVLGILQIQKGTAKGMAIAGIVCSSIGLILFIALTIYGNYLQSSGMYDEIMRELQMMQ